ncbi:hypothetical protein YC2023_089503 [Brassica napus]|uniref:(rape) hypothetical protein n=1 Tax=Brassica napus TaxID=3708 RepID=A0A816YCZ2_BRANA|nr:unnamed protein product [Brassica napus]
MGDSEDETGYPKKFYPLNRLNHPMYTRPIPKFQAYYREEDDEQEDDKIKEDKGEGYNHRGKERLQKMLKPNKSVLFEQVVVFQQDRYVIYSSPKLELGWLVVLIQEGL